MDEATVHTLTAIFALTHQVAVTAEDVAAVEQAGTPLSPELWREMTALFRGDGGRSGGALNLGAPGPIYRWLAVADEAAFQVAIIEAFARDGSELARLADAIEDVGAPAHDGVRFQITVAWCARAERLLAGGEATPGPAIEATEQAIAHCPPDDGWRRRLYEALAAASREAGDEARAAEARRRAEALEGSLVGPSIGAHAASARLLSILWCRAHDTLLLDAERGLDPDVAAAPELWRSVRAAIDEGRISDVPLSGTRASFATRARTRPTPGRSSRVSFTTRAGIGTRLPARAALSAGYDELAGSALLARIPRGLGPEGREESRALARQALEAHATGGGLEEEERADLERIGSEGDVKG